MAVAETAVTVLKQSPPRERILGFASIAGGFVLLLGFGLVFGMLPYLWSNVLPTKSMNEFLSGALLLIVGIAAIVAVCMTWYNLDRKYAVPGLRAGSFVAAATIFVITWLTFWLGNSVNPETGGMLITGLFAAMLLAATLWVFTRSAFDGWLIRLEENGWFTNQAFKGNQGVRVRRATVLGLLVIGLTGIYTMVTHKMFATAPFDAGEWYWRIPFTKDDELNTFRYLPLLPMVNVLGPILLGALVFWFSWRLVNWPTFADFLIATEAEINKVSWTTRKRLFADTIVVLVTVFVLTMFLFTVDIVWFKILSNPIVDVLHVNLKAEQAKQQEKTQW